MPRPPARTLIMEASEPLDSKGIGNGVYQPVAIGEGEDEHAVEYMSWATDAHSTFSRVLTGVIIANALQMGAEKQWTKENNPALEQMYLAMDCAFAAVYVVEVSCKIIALGGRFFADAMNWMDLGLTLMSVSSVALTISGKGSAALKKAKGLRLIRFVRIMRLVRILKGVPELAIVVEGLMISMTGLFWVMVLLGIFTFAYSVFLVEMIGGDTNEFGANYFGDMAHAFLTLVDMAILAEWAAIARPVMDKQPWLLAPLFMFVLISSFGMMNVMIGIIVDSTTEAKNVMDREKKTAALQEAVQVWVHGIYDKGLSRQAILLAEENDHLSELEKEELHQRRNDAVLEVIQNIIDNGSAEIPPGLVAEDVLHLLDFDADGTLTKEEFEQNLGRLMIGTPYQLTSLILVVIGKMRSRNRVHMHEVISRFDRFESNTHKRMEAIEESQARILKLAESSLGK